MKIAIGYKIKNSSWGGGNQFAKSLIKAAKNNGHEITYELKDKNIDIILLIDPRSYNNDITFGSLEIINYLLFKNKKAIVIHRINECDERKNTKYMNKLLRWSNYCADHNIFIASWLRNLNIYQRNKPSTVILNGGDRDIFYNYIDNNWDGLSPLKIVTHHWSPNFMKGFEVYRKLDNLLLSSEWKYKIEFTYIGNIPRDFKFKKAKHILPINGKALAAELSKHHIYISASINEPAGMHHIEGILCGLPILYRNSGALPEYCNGYGIPFEDDNYLPALEEMFKEYPKFKRKILEYKNDSKNMSNSYLKLFKNLIDQKDEIIKKRFLLRSPLLLSLNFIFLIISLKNIVKLFNKISFNKKYK